MWRLLFIPLLLLASPIRGERIVLQPSTLNTLLQTQSDGKTTGERGGFTELQLTGPEDYRNPWRAFLFSAVLPGAGEYYVGSRLKAKIFFAAEVGLWSALVSFRHLGNWRENDFKLYAAQNAGVSVEGKDDRFFDLIGFYDSRDEYNKIGGVTDPRREYFPDTDFYFWNWSSEAARERYRQLKNDSRTYHRNADFALGMIIANHFLSAVDAYWSAKRHNRRTESGFSGLDIRFREGGGWQVTLYANF